MKNNKALGQHWLKNREILDEIADLAAGGDEVVDLCLEIGPGLGTLTSSLLKRFDKVIAVEYDKRLAENLPNSFPGKNLQVLHEDILDADFAKMTKKKKYVIAGNIPYYITSPIIGKILEAEHKPERAVLLMQKEVADRVLATHGTTPLALLVENQAEAEAGPIIKAEEFEPAPKVDSQVVIFKMRKKPLWKGNDLDLGTILYMAFDAPRKKLINNLQVSIPKGDVKKAMDKAGIDRDARPGDLGLKEYQALWDALMEIDTGIGFGSMLEMLGL